MFVLLLAAATLGNNAWLIGYEEQTVLVSAQANLYATDLPPDDEVNWDPGGGGPGRYPTQIPLPPKGKQRVVVFPRVAGAVAAGSNPPFALHGPEGNTLNSTNIGSYLGMSGIVHDSHSMFLAGVFLEEERSTTGAPPRLNVSSLNGEDITAPGIAQTFMIGDGRYGQPNSHGDFLQAFLVPPSATRLVLGFVDEAEDQASGGRRHEEGLQEVAVGVRLAVPAVSDHEGLGDARCGDVLTVQGGDVQARRGARRRPLLFQEHASQEHRVRIVNDPGHAQVGADVRGVQRVALGPVEREGRVATGRDRPRDAREHDDALLALRRERDLRGVPAGAATAGVPVHLVVGRQVGRVEVGLGADEDGLLFVSDQPGVVAERRCGEE